jgi:hypothetical protein
LHDARLLGSSNCSRSCCSAVFPWAARRRSRKGDRRLGNRRARCRSALRWVP